MSSECHINALCLKLERLLNEYCGVFDRAGNYRKAFQLRWAFKVGDSSAQVGHMRWVREGYPGFIKHPFKETGISIISIQDRLEKLCGVDGELYDAIIDVYTM